MKNFKISNRIVFIKIVLLFNLLGIPVIFNSCNDLLEENPPSLISMESINEQRLDAAILGIYEPVTRQRNRTFESQLVAIVELHAEYIWGGGASRQNQSNYVLTEGQVFRDQIWATFYESIGRANILIDLVENSTNLSAASKNLATAEARFIRSIWHYQLVRLWGPIPLRVERVSDKDKASIGLSTVDSVYDAIINDLQFAEQFLPNKAGAGRATAGSAKAFLAEVYLTTKQFQKARDKAKEIIDNNSKYGYELVSDFSSLWSPTVATNSEDIFSIKYAQVIGYGSFHSNAWAPTQPRINGVLLGIAAGFSVGSAFEYGNANPASSLITGWDTKDIRQQYSLVDSVMVNGNWIQVLPIVTRNIDLDGNGTTETVRGLYTFGKYRDPGAPGEFGSGCDFYLMRYADVLLIFAEAENQVNNGPTPDAYAAINKVIRRAYKGSASYDVHGLSLAQFDDEVFKQRGYEFMQEAKRWFDIVRTNRFKVISDALKPLGPKGDLATNHYWILPAQERNINEKVK
jgi:starch-binding outer membrane protein, SusD/RagB family